MLLELLLAVPLPGDLQRLPPTHWLNGLHNLLLLGHWEEAVEIPSPSPAGVLARLYAALRQLDPAGQVRLLDEPSLLLEHSQVTPAPAELEEMPTAWQQGLMDGTFSFVGRSSELVLCLNASFFTRTSRGMPALRLSVRAVAAGLLPEKVEQNSTPVSHEAYVSALEQLMGTDARLRDLRTHLLTQGERLRQQLQEGLETLADGPLQARARVLVLRDPTPLQALLKGLPPEAALQLETVGRCFERIRPQIGTVYRRRKDGQLEVWRGYWHNTEDEQERMP